MLFYAKNIAQDLMRLKAFLKQASTGMSADNATGGLSGFIVEVDPAGGVGYLNILLAHRGVVRSFLRDLGIDYSELPTWNGRLKLRVYLFSIPRVRPQNNSHLTA